MRYILAIAIFLLASCNGCRKETVVEVPIPPDLQYQQELETEIGNLRDSIEILKVWLYKG